VDYRRSGDAHLQAGVLKASKGKPSWGRLVIDETVHYPDTDLLEAYQAGDATTSLGFPTSAMPSVCIINAILHLGTERWLRTTPMIYFPEAVR